MTLPRNSRVCRLIKSRKGKLTRRNGPFFINVTYENTIVGLGKRLLQITLRIDVFTRTSNLFLHHPKKSKVFRVVDEEKKDTVTTPKRDT